MPIPILHTDTGAGKIAAEDKNDAFLSELAEMRRGMDEVVAKNMLLLEAVKEAKEEAKEAKEEATEANNLYKQTYDDLYTATTDLETVKADLEDVKAELQRCQEELLGS